MGHATATRLAVALRIRNTHYVVDPGNQSEWATWLREQLEEREWTNAEFVRQSVGRIKPDRVSKWLSGREVPSHRSAVVAANTLGIDPSFALRAAGFDVPAGVMLRPPKLVRDITAFSDEELAVELLVRVRRRSNGDVRRLPHPDLHAVPLTHREAASTDDTSMDPDRGEG